MESKILYRYERENGGITDSLNKPDCKYIERLRLIADQGKLLTNDGENFCSVIDVDSEEGWYEVDVPEEETEGVD